MPTNPGIKSIAIPSAAHHLMSREAKRLKLSQADYTAAAVGYFAQRGLNPVETDSREGQLIMQQVKKLGDRVFSYMQVQERSVLLPMLEEMLRSRITLERVLRMNEILVNNLSAGLQQLSPAQLEQQRKALVKLREQNEEMIEAQVKEAIAGSKKQQLQAPSAGAVGEKSNINE